VLIALCLGGPIIIAAKTQRHKVTLRMLKILTGNPVFFYKETGEFQGFSALKYSSEAFTIKEKSTLNDWDKLSWSDYLQYFIFGTLNNSYEVYRFFFGAAQTTAADQWCNKCQYRTSYPGRFFV
jgi:hypothetical protein